MPGFPLDRSTMESPLDSPKDLDDVQQLHAELTEAKESLRQGQERWRLAMAAGRMVSWDWEISTGRVNLSQDWEALHGIPAGTFAGTFEAYQRDIHPEDRKAVMHSIRKAVEQGTDHHAEYRLVWPDGSIHWIEARGKVLLDDSGRPMRMIGICMDINERKRVEQSLHFLADASRSLAKLVDYPSTMQKVVGLAVPIFADGCAAHIADDAGQLHQLAATHADPGKTELVEEFGKRVQVEPGRPIGPSQVFRTGLSEMVAEISDSLLESGTQDEKHLRILRELKPASYICVPLALRGKILGTLTFITSESRRHYTPADLLVAEDLGHRAAIAIENAMLYAQVREADRRKDEFLALLAHELRNPLAPLGNGIDVLRTVPLHEEQAAQTLDMMQQQAENLVRLTDDLLDISRCSRGKLELRRRRVAVSKIITNAIQTAQPLIQANSHKLTVTSADETLHVNGDPTRLMQLVANLLNNAAKYTAPGGKIVLATERIGNEVTIRVQDNGIGIAAEMLPRIFEMFVQGDSSLGRSNGGLGIGLTLVKSLVEMHGGTVEAKSDGLGKGSEFAVRLPLLQDGEVAREEVFDAPQETTLFRSAKILVVDDLRSAAYMVATLLRSLGQQVRMTASGTEALAMIEQEKPDLIISDISMPGIDGYDLARAIRRRPEWKDIRLVAVTGYGQERDKATAKAAGFNDHVVKPVSKEDLKRLLEPICS
jgi:PAS domain S-box-containing protein